MARAIWTGSVSFGLVTIPVKLMTAVREDELRFNLLHDEDRGRITNVRRCTECGREVPWEHIIKGYEYEKDQYVVVSDEDFEQVNPEATRSVDIVEFVKLDEIDPILFDRPYYLEPEKQGRHAYALLRDALRKAGKVGIAKVVIRSREHLCAVKPTGDALVLELMHFAADIVDQSTLELPRQEEPAANEMKAAMMLVDTMSGAFDLHAFRDEYRAQLMALIEARAQHRPPPAAKPKARRRAEVVSLIDVLQRSVRQTRRQRQAQPQERRRPARGRRATKRRTAS